MGISQDSFQSLREGLKETSTNSFFFSYEIPFLSKRQSLVNFLYFKVLLQSPKGPIQKPPVDGKQFHSLSLRHEELLLR